MGEEEAYEPVVPMRVGNWRRWNPLEGRGEQTDVSGEGNMAIHRNRQNMSPGLA
jgi:hypothetical protein